MAGILTHGVRRVRDNHIKGFLILFHELKTISHVQRQLSTGIAHCHPWEVFFRYLDHILQHTESTSGSEAHKKLLLRLLCSCDWKNSTMSHFLQYLQLKPDLPVKATKAASIFSQLLSAFSYSLRVQ